MKTIYKNHTINYIKMSLNVAFHCFYSLKIYLNEKNNSNCNDSMLVLEEVEHVNVTMSYKSHLNI